MSLKDALDGCERILRDEFKDYSERSLYMIGTADEAKKETPSDKSGTKDSPKPEPKSEAKADSKTADQSQAKASSGPKSGAKPLSKGEHAADPHAP